MPRLFGSAKIVSAFVLGAVVAGCGGGGGGGGGGPIIQGSVAPALPSFALGAPVVLNVTLENVSGSDASVSTRAGAVTQIMALSRNGVAIAGTTTPLRIEEALAQSIDALLVVLNPGEEVGYEFGSSHEGGGQVLSAEAVNVAGNSEQVSYPLDVPGTYAITLRYRFQGTNPNGLPQAVATTGTFNTAFTIDP